MDEIWCELVKSNGHNLTITMYFHVMIRPSHYFASRAFKFETWQVWANFLNITNFGDILAQIRLLRVQKRDIILAYVDSLFIFLYGLFIPCVQNLGQKGPRQVCNFASYTCGRGSKLALTESP